MFILGYPTPPATAAAISNRPTILYNCNVHGNEPQGRESCFIFARMLAFTRTRTCSRSSRTRPC